MQNTCTLRVLPRDITLTAQRGENLLNVLRRAGLAPESYCGGEGRCGKCRVWVDGEELLSCRYSVEKDICVELKDAPDVRVLTRADDVSARSAPVRPGKLMAFDIGTTTVAGSLMDENGKELACLGVLNPQAAYGADVVSRIRAAAGGALREQTELIRDCLSGLAAELCRKAGIPPESVGTVSLVGNPAMQQLFLGLGVDNLINIPFRSILNTAEICESAGLIPSLPRAALLTVPDVSGYVGADTVGCVLSTELYASDRLTLLVDIGTNGEMVLGTKDRMLCCATAAGPALEGASIRFGMRAAPGAIDRVPVKDGKLHCHVMGGGEARGICGSGLIDAAAAALELGLINRRGKILSGDVLTLADGIYLTQDDIRQLQLAKGAIAAGIHILVREYGAGMEDIDALLLAGAFGSFLDAASACRIGLLPPVLRHKIVGIGNAALAGAKLAAVNKDEFARTRTLCRAMEPVELAESPDFRRSFAENMYFDAK